jgi:type I restriction enzyme S subunit
MAVDWEQVQLGDIVDINPSKRNRNWPFEFLEYVDISAVEEGFIATPAKRLSTAEAPSRAQRLILDGDTVLSTVRPNRRSMFFAKNPSPQTVVSTGFAVLRPRKGVLHPRYLYALVYDHAFTDYLVMREQGAAYPAVLASDIAAATVLLPPYQEQERIAEILGTLDDKIELNRRMAATLEEMARAIFKSWFIDFDPVRAKAEGRPTGLPSDIDSLFPDSFTEEGLPRGWKVAAFDEFIDRISVGRKFEQKTVLLTGAVPVLDQGRSGVIGYHMGEPGVRASKEDPVIVFANHTCFMRLIYFPFSAIQNVLPFVGKGVSSEWAYYATAGRVTFSEYKGHWPDFVRQLTVVPSCQLTEMFAQAVKPLLARKWRGEAEITTLATIRDTILPKLISGEISVREVDALNAKTRA